MTRATVPVNGGARIRTQELVPQPLLLCCPCVLSLPSLESWVLVGGVVKRLVPVFGGQAGFRSRFNSLSSAFPVTGKHLSVLWRPSNFVSKM